MPWVFNVVVLSVVNLDNGWLVVQLGFFLLFLYILFFLQAVFNMVWGFIYLYIYFRCLIWLLFILLVLILFFKIELVFIQIGFNAVGVLDSWVMVKFFFRRLGFLDLWGFMLCFLIWLLFKQLVFFHKAGFLDS